MLETGIYALIVTTTTVTNVALVRIMKRLMMMPIITALVILVGKMLKLEEAMQ